jgi:hypothetical protein
VPLHDWNKTKGWDGVHSVWIVELLRWIKPRLPEGYRAYIGSTPALTIGAADERPDVAVRQWLPEQPSAVGFSVAARRQLPGGRAGRHGWPYARLLASTAGSR